LHAGTHAEMLEQFVSCMFNVCCLSCVPLQVTAVLPPATRLQG
jgi:hypothetical protein